MHLSCPSFIWLYCPVAKLERTPTPPAFPVAENPISEGGHWLNGGVIGLDWHNVRTNVGLAYGTMFEGGGFNDSTAVLTGAWGQTQTVQATVHSVNQTSSWHGRSRTTVAKRDLQPTVARDMKSISELYINPVDNGYVQIVGGTGVWAISLTLITRTTQLHRNSGRRCSESNNRTAIKLLLTSTMSR